MTKTLRRYRGMGFVSNFTERLCAFPLPSTVVRVFSYLSGTDQPVQTVRLVWQNPEKDAEGNWMRRVARTALIDEGRKEEYSEEVAVRTIKYYSRPD